jgi:hypothetical protein
MFLRIWHNDNGYNLELRAFLVSVAEWEYAPSLGVPIQRDTDCGTAHIERSGPQRAQRGKISSSDDTATVTGSGITLVTDSPPWYISMFLSYNNSELCHLFSPVSLNVNSKFVYTS